MNNEMRETVKSYQLTIHIENKMVQLPLNDASTTLDLQSELT